MHPALSVIFFTTASGAGYGLLGLLGLANYFSMLPREGYFGLISIALALGLITAGLLSSTFHLGHPERAWRAVTQWRSSWLSREGVLAIITYGPAIIVAFAWIILQRHDTFFLFVGLFMSVLCFVTVFSTAMIYASLKTIHAWHNKWVPAVYLSLSLMTGLLLLNALLLMFGAFNPIIAVITVVAVIVAGIIKIAYWQFLSNTPANSSPGTATGLGALGKVTLFQTPHSQKNYIQKEMGFQIARKHAAKLRKITIICSFVLPFFLTTFTMSGVSVVAVLSGLAAALIMALGVFVERWLFFAEAEHAVMNFYGQK